MKHISICRVFLRFSQAGFVMQSMPRNYKYRKIGPVCQASGILSGKLLISLHRFAFPVRLALSAVLRQFVRRSIAGLGAEALVLRRDFTGLPHRAKTPKIPLGFGLGGRRRRESM